MKTQILSILLMVCAVGMLRADEDSDARDLLQKALNRVYKPEGLKVLKYRFKSPQELVRSGRLPPAAAFRATWEPDSRVITKPALTVANVADEKKEAALNGAGQLAMTPVLPLVFVHPSSPFMRFLTKPGYKLSREKGSKPPILSVTPPETEKAIKGIRILLQKTTSGLELSQILTTYKTKEGTARTTFNWKKEGDKLLLVRYVRDNLSIGFDWTQVRKRWVVAKAEMSAQAADRTEKVTTKYTDIELELYGNED